MKSAFSLALVRLSLLAYLTTSLLGTGLHALVDCDHHEHHEHHATAGLAVAASDGDAHDEHDCPICQFHRLAQLHVAIDERDVGVLLVERATCVQEQPAVATVRLPYSPRGPPERAVTLA